MNDFNDKESQGFLNSIKSAGQKAGNALGKGVLKLTGKAGKAGVKAAGRAIARAAKAFVQLIIKLVAAFGVWGILFLVLLILLGGIFYYVLDNRGAAKNFVLSPDAENPTYVNDEGLDQAIALSEDNALIDAYYKYLSVGSHKKFYDGHILSFGDTDDQGNSISEEDIKNFAGLMDYEKKEEYFYLSSYFIKLADEFLHDNEFYYPEQIIKTVRYETYIDTKTVEGDPNGEVSRTVTAVRALPLKDEEAGTFDATSKAYLPISDITDPYGYPNEYPSSERIPANQIRRPSRVEGVTYYGSQSSEEVPGVWDYGFGSMLQYGAYQKDEWIDCTYNKVYVHRHRHYWEETGEDFLGFPTYEEREECIAEASGLPYIAVDISDCTTTEEISAKIFSYNQAETSPGGDSWWEVEICPSAEVLANMSGDHTSHISLPIAEEDTLIATRKMSGDFAIFSNGKTPSGELGVSATNLIDDALGDFSYPITIPMIESAALMSGNIVYDNTYTTISTTLTSGSGISETEDATDIKYGQINGEGCNPAFLSTDLITIRSGNIYSNFPMSKENEEQSGAWGFSYVDAYGDYYSTYVPTIVQVALDFKSRITDNEYNLMEDLGLLKEYVGGPLSAVDEDVPETQIISLAKTLHNYSNKSQFERQLIAACLVNQLKDSLLVNFPNQASIYNDSDYTIATQALSGTFAIPKNVYYFDNVSHGDEYIVIQNNTGVTFYSSSGALSKTDWADRTAKDAEEIKELSEGKANSELAGLKLYESKNFDVGSALTLMQDNADFGGFFGVLVDLTHRISYTFQDVFKSLGYVFPSQNVLAKGDKLYWENMNRTADMRDAVYQAITFATNASYTEAAGVLENAEDISFLFVGKESGLGIGTSLFKKRLIPGTATTIDGFVSPTATYYNTAEDYGSSHQYIVVGTPEDTNVLSIGAGQVTSVVNSTGSIAGMNVTIRHVSDSGDIYIATYGNLKTINVHNGNYVNAKDIIGTTGADGLFFRVRHNDEYLNPNDYFYQMVWTTGAPFADLLDESGDVDETKVAALQEQLSDANHRRTTSTLVGTYDKWHSNPPDINEPFQCTWWAYGRMLQYLEELNISHKVLPAAFPDGGRCVTALEGIFEIGDTPIPNSIVSWSGGSNSYRKYGRYCGHVAFVEAVCADGSFWISESGASMTKPRLYHVIDGRYGSIPGDYQLVGFAYLSAPIE